MDKCRRCDAKGGDKISACQAEEGGTRLNRQPTWHHGRDLAALRSASAPSLCAEDNPQEIHPSNGCKPTSTLHCPCRGLWPWGPINKRRNLNQWVAHAPLVANTNTHTPTSITSVSNCDPGGGIGNAAHAEPAACCGVRPASSRIPNERAHCRAQGPARACGEVASPARA